MSGISISRRDISMVIMVYKYSFKITLFEGELNESIYTIGVSLTVGIVIGYPDLYRRDSVGPMDILYGNTSTSTFRLGITDIVLTVRVSPFVSTHQLSVKSCTEIPFTVGDIRVIVGLNIGFGWTLDIDIVRTCDIGARGCIIFIKIQPGENNSVYFDRRAGSLLYDGYLEIHVGLIIACIFVPQSSIHDTILATNTRTIVLRREFIVFIVFRSNLD